MTIFRLDPRDGSLIRLFAGESEITNPAFLRWHPTVNVLYGCTEDVKENGQIIAWEVDTCSGKLTEICRADAQGTSTCYLTLDHAIKNMLVVNYWDATIGVIPIKPDGSFAAEKLTYVYDPKGSAGMKVSANCHVNHSINDANAQKERQLDPHSHAVVLDPYYGCVAYVPDLGKDCIRELYYDKAEGTLSPIGLIPSGLQRNGPEGPRYLEFHVDLPVAYCVNEFASEVAVFVVDRKQLRDISTEGTKTGSGSTLTYVQAVPTVPPDWKRTQNTCGRIAIHPSGRFVLCSNRGHDSVAVFRVELEAEIPGMLSEVGIFHTRGMTPRHFKFDPSGQWLLAANQDSNQVATFNFNSASGEIKYTGTQLQVNSPNFLACVIPHMVPEMQGVEVQNLPEAKQKVGCGRMQFRGGSEYARGLAPALSAKLSLA
jgi:6-phosphogluconolactonase (cycloisomerase 2 family)